MTRVQLDRTFAAILAAATAACGGAQPAAPVVVSAPAPAPADAAPADAPLIATPADAAPAAAASAVTLAPPAPAIVVTLAPPAATGKPLQLQQGEARAAAWLRRRVGAGRPLVLVEPAGTGVTFLAEVALRAGTVEVRHGLTAAPLPPEVASAVAALALPGTFHVWQRDGAWFAGSLGAALFPLDTPVKVAAYLRMHLADRPNGRGGYRPDLMILAEGDRRAAVQGPVRWFVRDARTHMLVLLDRAYQACPHSDLESTLELVAVSRHGEIITLHGERRGRRTPCVGRDTVGSHRAAPAAPADSVGAYFAALAHDEATAVEAFTRLATELRRAGAPPDLISRAEAAAADERLHTALMRAHALGAGGAPVAAPARRSYPARPLAAMLRENAREGCVNETFAALIAAHQADAATDPDARATFARIASDERAHAELAWDLHRWALATRPALAAVLAAEVDQALHQLERIVAARAEAPWHGDVGEPPRALALAMCAGLRDHLHAQLAA
jgi:hypothetical protein